MKTVLYDFNNLCVRFYLTSLVGGFTPNPDLAVWKFKIFEALYSSIYKFKNVNQIVVAAITLTLFLPCVAQFSVMLKERGFRTTAAITLFVFPVAFLTGFFVNVILTSLGGV